MSKARAAGRLAAAAAYGGGGVGLVGGSLFGLIKLEAFVARKRIGQPFAAPPSADGVYGRGLDGVPVSFAMLGDSAAAGYGLERPEETPGAMIAAGLAELAGRPVRLTCPAKVGAMTRDLGGQIDRALRARADVAAIIVGTNDVTHKVKPAESVRLLDAAVRRLRDAGVEVVVGTCPDLGSVQPIAPPLRQIARNLSRRLAAAQTICVVEAGGRAVSLGSLAGPEFTITPDLFGPDRFHPSASGYASLSAVMLPSVASAMGVWPEEEERPDAFRGDAILPVSYAAAEAAEDAGTEVLSTDVTEHAAGTGGRLVLLRRLRRRPIPDVERVDDGRDPEDAARGQSDVASAGASQSRSS